MSRALGVAGFVAIAVVLAFAGLRAPGALRQARVGVGYVAKQVCSCLYVAGRDLDACRADLLPAMDAIAAQPLERGEGVEASLAGLLGRVARHRQGSGCTLE